MKMRCGTAIGNAGARRRVTMLLGALILACVVASPAARAKTITCGDPANPATQVLLNDAKTAQGYVDGDDLEVVGTCVVSGGLMGNQPIYRFGKVNIFSKSPQNCPVS